MIANYGYEDGTGQFYISIDTDKCAECDTKACVDACELEVYVAEEDDWGDEVVIVNKSKTLMLHDLCVACKRSGSGAEPCVVACDKAALKHSW